jgi:hypothetical protein
VDRFPNDPSEFVSYRGMIDFTYTQSIHQQQQRLEEERIRNQERLNIQRIDDDRIMRERIQQKADEDRLRSQERLLQHQQNSVFMAMFGIPKRN